MYNEYHKYVDFKQETGWYEEPQITLDILNHPKFKLPEITTNNFYCANQFVKTELTTAENFFNMQKMKEWNVNHNSIQSINH